MKAVIIEDEDLAAEKLIRYLQKFNASLEVVSQQVSINGAVNWFREHPDGYDVAFFDIQLTDGLSFEIFHQVKINKPVIFTTAFDEYAIDAFKVNSIDYILKPITFMDVSKAMNKLKTFKNMLGVQEAVEEAEKMIEKKKMKDRFLVKLGNHIHSIKTNEIALFYADGRTVYLVTNENKKFIIDYKLEDLNNILDATVFYRVNRTFIVNINTIKDVIVYSNNRLKITPKVRVEKEIIVSREKVSTFKKWFEGN